ncbi:13109_t:CDS:1, partial [Ambispora leptoticha]
NSSTRLEGINNNRTDDESNREMLVGDNGSNEKVNSSLPKRLLEKEVLQCVYEKWLEKVSEFQMIICTKERHTKVELTEDRQEALGSCVDTSKDKKTVLKWDSKSAKGLDKACES